MVSYIRPATKRNALAYDTAVALFGSKLCGESTPELDLDVPMVDSDNGGWKPDRHAWKKPGKSRLTVI